MQVSRRKRERKNDRPILHGFKPVGAAKPAGSVDELGVYSRVSGRTVVHLGYLTVIGQFLDAFPDEHRVCTLDGRHDCSIHDHCVHSLGNDIRYLGFYDLTERS